MSTRPGICPPAQRGVILVPVVFLALIIAGLSLGFLIEAEGGVNSVRLAESRLKAFEIAEMGIVLAELEIRGRRDNADDGIGNVSGSFAGGTYVVAVAQELDSDERWTLTARGSYGHSVRRLQVGVRRRAKHNAVEGLYAKEELVFGGAGKTDAFDSRAGDYANQATSADAAGSYAEAGGDIGSGMGISVLGASTTVRGSAIPGPGFTTDVSGGALVTGDSVPRLVVVDLPPTPYQEFLDAYDSNQNAELTGANAAAEPEVHVESIEDADLEGLSDTQVDSLTESDMMTMTDAQADERTFDELLTDNYTTYLTTVDPTLLDFTKAEYDEHMIKLRQDLSYAVPVDADDATSGGTTTPTGSTNGAGRVSYNALTGELRATAGAELILDGGVYFFSDIRLVGNSKLIVRGPSKIYVTGRLDFGGGSIVNETGSAENLRIFAHPYALPTHAPPSTTLVKLRGGSAIAASIYAPEVSVTVGGGDNYYGSILAKTISLLGGVFFHYDQALAELNADKRANLERLFWRELGAR